MEILDGTVIATALPNMAASFGVSPVDLSIGMTAYMLTLAAFIPVSGWVAERFGARAVFGGAVALFTLASALCGISRSLWQFVAARVLQGTAGAMMVPVGRLVVLRTTEKKDLMAAIAFLSWPALVAPILGPPVGGFITTYASWRWIFFLNLPLGLLGCLLVCLFFDDKRSDERRAFDAPGFLLTSTALGCLMYGLDQIAGLAEHWQIAATLLLAGLSLGTAAVLHFRHRTQPLLDLTLLRIPTFAAMVWSGGLFRLALGAVPFLLPLMFQVGFGMDAFTSGLLLLPIYIGNLGMKAATMPILKRFGFRAVLIGNGVLSALSLVACGLLSADTPIMLIVLVGFAGGLCRSMQFTSLITLFFVDVPAGRMSSASTFSSMVIQLCVGLGVAFGATTLHLVSLLRTGTASIAAVGDFRVAFALSGLVALLASLKLIGLDRAAGAEVSGHLGSSASPAVAE